MEPGDTFDIWEEIDWHDFNSNAGLRTMRWFEARPDGYVPAPGGFPNGDQIIAITDRYDIVKGTSHLADGSGGAGDLQINVVVENRSTGNDFTAVVVLEARTAD
jgi:hypothetical protein